MPDFSVPDRIPEDLVERYGKKAWREVRHRRSWWYLLAERARRVAAVAADGELWTTAVMIFGCLVVGLGVVAGLVYAVVMWPWIGLYVFLPSLVLLGVSFWWAVRLSRRERTDRRRVVHE